MKKQKALHILLVDDEHFLRQNMLRRITELETDFVVEAQASDGQEALNILKEKDIQLVFTDIRMPVMDGLELSKKIHTLYPDILTIILTGYADFSYAQEALRYGVFDYLLKPVDSEQLESVLNHALLKLKNDYEISDDDAENQSSLSPEESVEKAISYMQQHYMEDIDIATLAEKLGFHSAYLTKLFNRYAGESPLKYLTNIRIHEAKRLLKDTSLSIGAVGEKVGYPDQFHFSKTFRKVTGVNPSSFRKQTEE